MAILTVLIALFFRENLSTSASPDYLKSTWENALALRGHYVSEVIKQRTKQIPSALIQKNPVEMVLC
jgi:hypothetical protein